MAKHRIYSLSFASVYPHYIAKAQKKGRTGGDWAGSSYGWRATTPGKQQPTTVAPPPVQRGDSAHQLRLFNKPGMRRYTPSRYRDFALEYGPYAPG